MKNATALRALFGAVFSMIAALGLAVVAPAQARAASPDVHVTGVVRVCGNDVTVYHFRLENFGDRSRKVNGRAVYNGQGFYESFSRHVRTDWRTIQRKRVYPGERVTVTFRSQGQVILRAPLVGDCPTKSDTV